MTPENAGYSGTPLVRKLGIKEGCRLCVFDAPPTYRSLVTLPAGATLTTKITRETDIIHIFATERAQLTRELSAAVKKMRDDAVIWVSWPKKSSLVPTDITEDTIRAVAFPFGLVDIKVCAVDDTWSGLKLMIRKENRRG